MKVSVIIGHPYEKSFNHAIAETVLSSLAVLGHDVFFHDLYKEGFDALLTGPELITDATNDSLIEQHKYEIRQANGIVIIHPNWWGQTPAILKGWIDRILREGVAYRFDENDNGSGIPYGLLIAETAVVFNTSNTPAERENEAFGDPLETIWKNCVFSFCGVNNFYRKMFRVIAGSTLEQRKEWLEDVQNIIIKCFPAD